jgi:hypothetical protein
VGGGEGGGQRKEIKKIDTGFKRGLGSLKKKSASYQGPLLLELVIFFFSATGELGDYEFEFHLAIAGRGN